MSGTVKKFKDGKYHATFGEYMLSETIERLEKLDLPEETKIAYIAIYKQAFELGFAAGKESNRLEFANQVEKLCSMSPEALSTYSNLLKLLETYNSDNF